MASPVDQSTSPQFFSFRAGSIHRSIDLSSRPSGGPSHDARASLLPPFFNDRVDQHRNIEADQKSPHDAIPLRALASTLARKLRCYLGANEKAARNMSNGPPGSKLISVKRTRPGLLRLSKGIPWWQPKGSCSSKEQDSGHCTLSGSGIGTHRLLRATWGGAVAACQLHPSARAFTYCDRVSIDLVGRRLSKYCASHLTRYSVRQCWALRQISAKSSCSKSSRSFCMAQLHEIFGENAVYATHRPRVTSGYARTSPMKCPT